MPQLSDKNRANLQVFLDKNDNITEYNAFARLAAIPQLISADLLYQLWSIFKENHNAPFWVVSDLLLSNLSSPIGARMFRINEDIRKYLISELDHSTKKNVAQFLEEYANHNKFMLGRAYDIHKLTALNILNKKKMEEGIIEAINKAKNDDEKLSLLRLHFNISDESDDSSLYAISKAIDDNSQAPILVNEIDENNPDALNVNLPKTIRQRIKLTKGKGVFINDLNDNKENIVKEKDINLEINDNKKINQGTTLHAILIAINDYPNNPLKGCINDVENMRTTLADFCKIKGLSYKEYLLSNNAATRPAIIEAYKQFKAALEGDTCLVYYSGHGYRIAANPSQWTDGNSLHEAIYTFDADTGGRGLVNKELAYLMWKNTQHVNNVHIVEIFDCSYIGGITRSVGNNVIARTIPGESKALPQQEYFGFQEYINNGNGRFAAPVARRVQLAASYGKETSKELTINNLRRGAFTTSICEILREDNFNVSYKDLLAKANVKVKNYIKDVKKDFGDQSPQIDAERVESETQVFTGKGMAVSQSYIVGFSQESGFWEIKAGQIEGIPENAQIRITETGETFIILEIGLNISKVLLPQKYDRSKQYHAEIIASFNNKIIVAFAPQVTENQKNIFNTTFAKSYDEKGLVPRFFEKIEDVQFASFLIHCEGNDFYLTTKKDVHTPLFLRYPPEDLAAFFEASEKVGKWFIVKDLNNPSSALTTNDIKVEIATYSALGNYERPIIKNWQDGIPTECTYDLIQDTLKQPRIALSITNNARKPLWISVAFLSSDFSITNKVIPTGKELVEHADKVRLNVNGEEKIWLSIPKGLRQKNVLEVTEYFKIFVSTDELSTDSYNQSESIMYLAAMRSLGTTKSIESEEEVEEPTTIVTPDWRTYDVELRIKMPSTTARVIGGEGGATIANHTIAAPSGFEADISIGATSDAQRTIGVSSAAAKLEEVGFQPYFLSLGMATGASQSTLTFKKVENAAVINVDNSLKIGLPNRSNDEMVVAMAYDSVTGLYYPTGFENAQGELEIHTLPEPTNDGQRSLGGSVVMFLQKLSLPVAKILGKGKTDDDIYKLRIAKIPLQFWQEIEYETDETRIAAEITKAKKIILFVNGIIGDTTDQVKALKRMNTDFPYDVILTFDYENLDVNLERIASKLKVLLENVGLNDNHGKELHIVANSIGGLVTRWFIEQLGGDKIVNQLIMIGTPNNGTDLFHLTSIISLGIISAVNFANSYFESSTILQSLLVLNTKYASKRILKALTQMNTEGEFIKKLNEKGEGNSVVYHIIAGDIFAINLTYKDNGIFRTFMGLTERGQMAYMFKQSNDIFASVESITKVKGVNEDNKFEIAVNHMSYFTDLRGVIQLELILQKINSNIDLFQNNQNDIIKTPEEALDFFLANPETYRKDEVIKIIIEEKNLLVDIIKKKLFEELLYQTMFSDFDLQLITFDKNLSLGYTNKDGELQIAGSGKINVLIKNSEKEIEDSYLFSFDIKIIQDTNYEWGLSDDNVNIIDVYSVVDAEETSFLEIALKDKITLDAKVVSANIGGLILDIRGKQVFLPSSKIADGYIDQKRKYKTSDLNKRYLNKLLRVKIIDYDKERKTYIASCKPVIEENIVLATPNLALDFFLENPETPRKDEIINILSKSDFLENLMYSEIENEILGQFGFDARISEKNIKSVTRLEIQYDTIIISCAFDINYYMKDEENRAFHSYLKFENVHVIKDEKQEWIVIKADLGAFDKETTLEYIAANKLDEAFKFINKFIAETGNKEDFQEAILLQGRYANLKKKEIQGTISYQEANLKRNQLNARLLGFLEGL